MKLRRFKTQFFLLTFLLNMSSVCVFSQQLIFQNVKDLNLESQITIKNGDELKGYCLIYENDTIDNYRNYFEIALTNEKLIIYKQFELTLPQASLILETSSNGNEIIFLFFHRDDKTFEYQIFDINGLLKNKYLRKLSNKEYRQYSKASRESIDELTLKSIHAIDTSGFVSNTLHVDKDITSISIDFYGTKVNKHWTYVPKDGGNYFYGEYLGVYKNIIYLNVCSFKESVYNEKLEFFIAGVDLNTGKELFKMPAEKGNKLLAKGIQIFENGAAYLYGSYYKKDANLRKDKSAGFAFWKLREIGGFESEKYISYEDDFNDYFDVSVKGRIKGIGSIYLHNVVQSKSGDLFILGECHTKVLDLMQVAKVYIIGFLSTLLEGFTKEVSTDMVLFNFDSNFIAKKITFFDKKNSNNFCYNTTQNNDSTNSFSFWYFSNFSKYLNSISVTNDEVKTNKLKLNDNTRNSIVLPAENENVLFLEYYRLSKKATLHFEKFN